MIRSILLLMLILRSCILDACQISSGNVYHCRCFIDCMQKREDHNYLMCFRGKRSVLDQQNLLQHQKLRNQIQFKDHLDGDFFDSLFSGGVWITAHTTSPPDQTLQWVNYWSGYQDKTDIPKEFFCLAQDFQQKSLLQIYRISYSKNLFISMHQLDGGHL